MLFSSEIKALAQPSAGIAPHDASDAAPDAALDVSLDAALVGQVSAAVEAINAALAILADTPEEAALSSELRTQAGQLLSLLQQPPGSRGMQKNLAARIAASVQHAVAIIGEAHDVVENEHRLHEAILHESTQQEKPHGKAVHRVRQAQIRVHAPTSATPRHDTSTQAGEPHRAAPHPIDPVKVAAAQKAFEAVRTHDDYRVRAAAARELAVASAGGDREKEDSTDWQLRKQASFGKLKNTQQVAEAVSRNMMDAAHELRLKQLLADDALSGKDALDVFDMNHDGKVEFWEFDRVRRERFDMSYQQMAALTTGSGWFKFFDDRTVSTQDLAAATHAMIELSGLATQDMQYYNERYGKNQQLNANGGELTLNDLRMALNRRGMRMDDVDTDHNQRISRAEMDEALAKILPTPVEVPLQAPVAPAATPVVAVASPVKTPKAAG